MSPIKIGTANHAPRIGGDEVARVYVGDDLVFVNFEPQDMTWNSFGTFTINVGKSNRVYITGQGAGGGGGGGTGGASRTITAPFHSFAGMIGTGGSGGSGANGGDGWQRLSVDESGGGAGGGEAGGNGAASSVSGGGINLTLNGGGGGNGGHGGPGALNTTYSGGVGGTGTSSSPNGATGGAGGGITSLPAQIHGTNGSAGKAGGLGQTLTETGYPVTENAVLTIIIGGGGDIGHAGRGGLANYKVQGTSSSTYRAPSGANGTAGADGWIRIRTARV